jgi:hypothetical protein
MPPHHRPFIQWETGDDGSVWIRLSEADASANRWLAVEPGGTRGTFNLPSGAIIRWMSGDRMWVSEPDAFEVPWLVRYRLADPPGS